MRTLHKTGMLLALMGMALLGSGCASFGSSSDPLRPNFDPDLYRDSLKQHRAKRVPPQHQPATVAEKLRDGDLARQSGEPTRALWSYLQAHKLDREDPIPIERIALLHMKRDPQRAEALFARLAERDPKSPSAHTGIGLARLAKDDLVGAEHFLRRALELDPDWAPALSALAVAADRQDRPAEAQELYRRALQVKPGDYGTLNNLGVSYATSGLYIDALRTFQSALLIEDRDPAVHNNLGLVLGRLGRYDEAESHFERGGDAVATLNNMAYVHFLNGDYERAIELYEQALLRGTGDDSITVLRNMSKAHDAMIEGREAPGGSMRTGLAPPTAPYGQVP